MRTAALLVYALVLTRCAAVGGSGANPSIVAHVDTEVITSAELDAATRSDVAKLSRDYDVQVYETKRRALDSLLFRKLVERKARDVGMEPDAFLTQELGKRSEKPKDEDVRLFYEANKEKLGSKSYDEVAPRVLEFMAQQKRSEAIVGYYAELRKSGNVRVLLTAPPVVREQVGTDGPSLGPETAPVVIVSFSDFECPYCSKGKATLEQVRERYPDRVRIVFRHYPLPFHANAEGAAQASECAHEQGKFWAMHDFMFANQGSLDPEGLAEGARAVGLDSGAFEICLRSGRADAIVQASMEEGARLGVRGTPHFFVNGIALSGAQPLERFVELIERELAAREPQK